MLVFNPMAAKESIRMICMTELSICQEMERSPLVGPLCPLEESYSATMRLIEESGVNLSREGVQKITEMYREAVEIISRDNAREHELFFALPQCISDSVIEIIALDVIESSNVLAFPTACEIDVACKILAS